MIFPSVLCEYRWSVCNNASTYKEGSAYSTNLKRVISDLSRNAPQSSGFNTSYRGQSPNKVYGLLQCMGNISAAKCSNCSMEANSTIQEVCGNDIGGRVWIDYCFLRYDNSNFISTLDTNFVLLENIKDVTQGNLIASKRITFGLLSDLIDLACLPASMGFFSGKNEYSSTMGNEKASGQVYGLVQCWRDISIKDCRNCLSQAKEALESCCYTKQGAQAMSASCTLRYEIYPFVDPPAPPSITPSLPPQILISTTKSPGYEPSPMRSNKSSGRLWMILGIIIGSIVIFAACSLAILRKFKSAVSRKPVTLVRENEDVLQRRLFKKEQISFTLETLIEATEDFNDNNKLGEGGFGPVYKGTTRNGKQIAVKKLSARSAQGKREFMNEVELVANIQHRNLVNLLGCCTERTERLLVYEYLPNKSLDTFLFDPLKRRILDWQKRFNIIIGIARGLLYLHEDSQFRIIHRDIKANNILLDEQLNPKIADFGLARLFSDNETEIQSKVAGTYGYMAPEYAIGGQLSVKVDVYSFGVVLLEIVSGKKNTDMNLSKEKQSLTLLEWAWRLFKGGHALNIVDIALVGNCPEEQVIRCAHIGLLCTQADPDVRPLMSNIVTMLTTNSVPLPVPTRPAFVSMSSQSPNVSFIPAISSRNETSISNLEPR
ncbi:hypothetical protein SUGI_0421930 [Cryptomeria japonica]|nr:hypothetical protein SUGI_0421930 [Cryptomeria japonica]